MWKVRKNKRQIAFNTERVLMAAKTPLDSVFTYFQTTSLGLSYEEVEKRQSLYGKNEIVHEKKKKPLIMFAKAFDKGITKVGLLLIRFMLIMVPIVFLVNGITKGDWMEAFIFAVSIAVGLTPEMLPMIVTANLSKGALAMSRKI